MPQIAEVDFVGRNLALIYRALQYNELLRRVFVAQEKHQYNTVTLCPNHSGYFSPRKAVLPEGCTYIPFFAPNTEGSLFPGELQSGHGAGLSISEIDRLSSNSRWHEAQLYS